MSATEPLRMRGHQPSDELRLHFPLPPLDYSHDYEDIVEGTREWARPYTRYLGARDHDILDSCAYSANMCLNPRVPQHLRVWFSAVSSWLLLSDDLYDRGTIQDRQQRYAEVAPQQRHALLTPLDIPDPDRLHPLSAYIWALRRYGEEHAPPAAVRGVMKGLERGLRETATEIGYAVRAEHCGADEYIRRLLSGAKYTGAFTTLEEVCNRLTIPENERRHPIMQGLYRLTGTLAHLHLDFAGWANDGPGEAYNLINAVAHDLEIPPCKAGPPAVELVNLVMELFLQLREKLKPQIGEATRTLLDELDWMLRGNMDWALYTTRYAGDTNPMRLLLPEEHQTPVPPPRLDKAPCPALGPLFDLLT